jgi:hypothetical protein
VAEYNEQSTLESFVSANDSAMARTAEIPSAAIDARKASDSQGNIVQRTEAQSGRRNNVPMTSDKVRVRESGGVLTLAGDSCREKGGTRELKVTEGVHSPSKI